MRRTHPVIVLSFFSLLLSGCFLRARQAECTLHGGKTWYEITTPHFRVQTNHQPSIARDCARKMERNVEAAPEIS